MATHRERILAMLIGEGDKPRKPAPPSVISQRTNRPSGQAKNIRPSACAV